MRAPPHPGRRGAARAPTSSFPLSIRLTILGKSPSWQDRDGACSSYLVEAAGLTLMIDCGSGAFAKLRSHHDYAQVDAIIVSHLHADHTLDLVPFAYALTVGPRLRSDRPVLHAPPGARAAWQRLCGAWGSKTLIEDAFELREYDPSGELELDGVRVRFQPVPHYVPAYALELRTSDGPRRLVFSADCGPNDELVEFARGAELLLIEATRLDQPLRPDEDPNEPPGHLSASDAGTIGRRSGVGRIVLTHYSDQLDAAEIRAQAEAAFGGPVELAREGERYEI
jgi:ribonuclease BN (tRNA processing enzyme)